jgi:membrane fusion protein, multidrug efflux system
VVIQLGDRRYRIMLDGARAKLAQTALALQAMKDDYRRMLKDVETTKAKVVGDQAWFTSVQERSITQLARPGGNDDARQADAGLRMSRQYRERGSVSSATRSWAPLNGIVTNVEGLQRGQCLAASAHVFDLVSTSDVFVTAEPKETQLTNVLPGSSVTITVGTNLGQAWKNQLESIAPALVAIFLAAGRNSSATG